MLTLRLRVVSRTWFLLLLLLLLLIVTPLFSRILIILFFFLHLKLNPPCTIPERYWPKVDLFSILTQCHEKKYFRRGFVVLFFSKVIDFHAFVWSADRHFLFVFLELVVQFRPLSLFVFIFYRIRIFFYIILILLRICCWRPFFYKRRVSYFL